MLISFSVAYISSQMQIICSWTQRDEYEIRKKSIKNKGLKKEFEHKDRRTFRETEG